MSQESSTWLNTRTLIGFTEKRGNAWHYRAEDQGDESNHYTRAVPVEDVRRRLFNWKPVEGSLAATVLDENGVATYHADDRKAIIRPAGSFGLNDKGEILGIFKSGYKIHDYDQWLVRNVESLLDQDAYGTSWEYDEETGLFIASAGLLKGGALAWVQFQTPKTLEHAGFKFRPFLSASTSLDGSMSSTYFTGVDAVVCDNTLAAGISHASTKIKVKHSRNSIGQIANVQEALEIVGHAGDAFQEEIETLTNITVSDGDWSKFLDEIASLKTDKGDEKEGRSLALATTKRAGLNRLWFHDERVKPWANTAFGVVQAVNTFEHHEGIVRGATRADRNAERAIKGDFDKLDQSTFQTLEGVLA